MTSTSETQQEALAALAEVWALSPDVRLGHLGFLGEAHLGRGLGDIDDDELMSNLCRHREELLARQPTAVANAVSRMAARWAGNGESTSLAIPVQSNIAVCTHRPCP